jgi:tRNA modification GTPase
VDSGETFVTLLTPEGRGAIAVLRVWGDHAIQVVNRVFRPARGSPLAQAPAGRLRLGRLGPGQGDEVVAVILEGEQPAVEIHCHGGHAALSLVMGALEEAGARRASPSQGIPSAGCDLLAADAMADVPFAPTLRTTEILLDQVHGALRSEIKAVLAAVDRDPGHACARLDALLERATVGVRLCRGWKVVIAGRPNVGKSRLLNALAGFTRAIVDPAPGTTRDTVTVRTSFDGWPVELVDTAGVHRTEDQIELEGIARARREHSQADLVILVLDRSEALQAWDRELIAGAGPALIVANKSDLRAAWEPPVAGLESNPPLTVSAERGDGLPSLIESLVDHLVPSPPAPGVGVPFRDEHVELLRQARESLLAQEVPAAQGLLVGFL